MYRNLKLTVACGCSENCVIDPGESSCGSLLYEEIIIKIMCMDIVSVDGRMHCMWILCLWTGG